MDADWDELLRITVPAPSALELAAPASTLAFDTQQELLWVGNETGIVTSFLGPDLRKYTSVVAHPATEGPVKQLLFHERGIISIAPTSVHLFSRRGLTLWHLKDEDMKDLCCMSYVGKENAFIIVAGCQDTMLKIDIEKGRIIERIPSEHEYTMMKQNRYICAATSTGSVNILDTDTLKLVKTLNTNNVRICDMDARNNYLVTCGWVTRPQGTPMLANLANVFDLRAMVQLPPIPFHAGAAHVQMHPKMSTTCIIASQNGQLQVVDLMNSNNVNLRQANISQYVAGLVLAPSGEALVLADADATIHLWGSPTKLQFSEFSNAVELADHPEPVPMLEVDADVPLNMVGMNYYREQLLSAWTSTQVFEVGNPPSKIDPIILSTMRRDTHDLYARAPNPRKLLRNQADKTRIIEPTGTLAAPKFLSEKAREGDNDASSERRISDIQETLADTSISGSMRANVPVMYRNVEIKYSKFGVDDFDFEYYNKTQFSGLETHITNSYTNPLLQLFKFTPLVRNLALHHTATTCMSETCLLCEMGFLFDTLEKAEGQSCQATNLLKTFNSIPEAGRLGLLEENSQHATLEQMIQASCRFVLEQISADFRNISPRPMLFDQIFTIDALSSIRCVHCHNETIRHGGTNITDLIYRPTNTNNRLRIPPPTFSQVLKASIENETQMRGWCDKCRKYQQLATRKAVRSVPDVLMINAALKADTKQYWSIPGWLPDTIGVIFENGKFFCFEGEDLRLHLQRGMHVVKVYDLVGIVADINSGEHQQPHLVSLINVALSNRIPTEESNWHLFNDFLVRKLSKDDAQTFFPTWKMPAILAFQVSTARHAVDDTWKSMLDTTLLYHDNPINHQPPQNCTVLRPESEAPVAGTYVAIDTEFVALQQEEIEIKADGEREIVRPTRLGLARVSVLRGSGEDQGLPFINDYITIHEPIVDYLTKWSGVHSGDLDPHYSTHHLVALKVAYKKLWLLLNLGCIFIGHGLPKDFRTINIHVPKSQVLDTVDLFYIRARQRKLSLRFLAWYLLKEDIQAAEHDSIEDARTALRLLRKFEEFRHAGVADTMVEEVYREGKRWGYKPPGEGTTTALAPGAANAAPRLLSASRRREFVPSDASSAAAAGAGVGAALDGWMTPDLVRSGSSVPGTPLGRRAQSSAASGL